MDLCLNEKELAMSPKEREMFEHAYMNNVSAVEDRQQLKKFLDEYFDDNADQQDLYNRYDCYTSIVDALCLWLDAVRFVKENAKDYVM